MTVNTEIKTNYSVKSHYESMGLKNDLEPGFNKTVKFNKNSDLNINQMK